MPEVDGDGVAAEWYSDNFAAWWGNHQYELDYGHQVDYEPGLSEVRLGITELDWQSAEQMLAELCGALGKRRGTLVQIELSGERSDHRPEAPAHGPPRRRGRRSGVAIAVRREPLREAETRLRHRHRSVDGAVGGTLQDSCKRL